MIKKLYKQHQTKNFFELDAANWKRKSDVKKINYIIQYLRETLCNQQVKHLKIKSLIMLVVGG